MNYLKKKNQELTTHINIINNNQEVLSYAEGVEDTLSHMGQGKYHFFASTPACKTSENGAHILS